MSQTRSQSQSRPPSQASTRPLSRVSNRPFSRHSNRLPLPRQNPRIFALYETLITEITGIPQDDPQHASLLRDITKDIDNMSPQGSSETMDQINLRLRGMMQKARVRLQDQLADALDITRQSLVHSVEQRLEFDQELKARACDTLSTLPSHLQFLLSLSRPASDASLQFADEVLAQSTNPESANDADRQLWREIMGNSEDSEGFLRDDSGSDSSSLSSWDFEDRDAKKATNTEDKSVSEAWNDREYGPLTAVSVWKREDTTESTIDSFTKRQYWNNDTFMPAKPSAFPLHLVQRLQRGVQTSDGEPSLFTEPFALREVLMAMQGFTSSLFASELDPHGEIRYSLSSEHPLMSHLSPMSQASILSRFAEAATLVQRLRLFCQNISCTNRHLTSEALQQAVQEAICAFDGWCSEKENDINAASLGFSDKVASLLALDRDFSDNFESKFEALWTVIQKIKPLIHRNRQLSLTRCIIENICLTLDGFRAVGNEATGQFLLHVLGITISPLWAQVMTWIAHGMPFEDDLGSTPRVFGPLEGSEKFIERSEIHPTDPDYWADAYTLHRARDANGPAEGLPSIFSHDADKILSTGKAVGLLRALKIHDESGRLLLENWMNDPPSFKSAVLESIGQNQCPSLDDISAQFSAFLVPKYMEAQSALLNVLKTECRIESHLNAVEDICLTRRGDIITQFCDVLFARMDSSQPWDDFHWLNRAFGDVLRSKHGKTLLEDPTRIRLYLRRVPRRSIHRSLKALDGLVMDYAFTFPANYIFGSCTVIYSRILALLLQLRRAKSLIDTSIFVSATKTALTGQPLASLLILRVRLSWFLGVLFDFITTYVISRQNTEFCNLFTSLQTVDELRRCHEAYLDRLLKGCFLHDEFTSLYDILQTILDLTLHLHFHLTNMAVVSPTVSQHPWTKHKRAARKHKRRANRVTFVDDVQSSDEDSPSDSSDDEDDEPIVQDQSSAIPEGGSPSLAFPLPVDELYDELDRHVRLFRKGVESIARRSPEKASMFEYLTFTIDAWDRY
ncbi:hypothetical protein SISNIDRAFT_481691 [Sistotremastrum niveocremeum HHB9708]|uniref:Spindle pole body component n=1 Tax=Sistotremastrum niveocremeum HHB9708 TaxID=1314777 RepID=A0A164ZK24_9AGAM|nr:hypothetical protein SISNIDRAFT_481691 [Sistotremastrum niveocremeum HHB9708]